MVAITRNHKNGWPNPTIKDKDLQQKPNTIKFGSVFNLNMLVILDISYYRTTFFSIACDFSVILVTYGASAHLRKILILYFYSYE